MNKWKQVLFPLVISAPAIMAIAGTLVYFTYGLNKTGAYLAAVIWVIGMYLLYRLVKKEIQTPNQTIEKPKIISKKEWLIGAIFLVVWIIAVWLLYSARSDRPMITPWEVVSGWYFTSYVIGAICLFFLGKYSSRLLPLALIFQSILLFGTAVTVYRIGYGFDPFIHEAAVNAIMKLGQIKPLTPYYLGQYSIVIILEALTALKAVFWAKLLVPGLVALFLPLMAFRWLKNHHGTEHYWGLAAIMTLILPATIFIITTPQSLAYLFLIIVLLWPSPKEKKSELAIVWLCALAALVTQPIAGIPAILIALSDTVRGRRYDNKLYLIILLLFIIAIPSAFYVFTALGQDTSISLIAPNLAKTFGWLIPTNPTRESWWLNFVYLYEHSWGLIIAFLAISGGVIAFKKRSKELLRRFALPALALIVCAFVSSALDFRFLINYERSDYPERIMVVAVIFSLPLILMALRALAIRLEKVQPTIFYSWLVIIVFAMTTSLYLSYPRFDDYVNSHGYATSKADILAARWIENDGQETDYIVLANQQVSAAALREFGFSRYYNDLFYYPIPTGGPLYQYYLAMVEKPQRETIKQAMSKADVKTAYFVLNNYWWRFKYLVPETTPLADEIKDIGEGQVKVFKFTN